MGVVYDVDELVVELGAGVVAVGGGVVASAAQDGDELGSGLEEAAAFTDRVESAVGLDGSGAMTVAEQTSVELGGVTHRVIRVHRSCAVAGFEGAGGVEVLVGDGGVGDAGVDERHPRRAMPKQRSDGLQ